MFKRFKLEFTNFVFEFYTHEKYEFSPRTHFIHFATDQNRFFVISFVADEFTQNIILM